MTKLPSQHSMSGHHRLASGTIWATYKEHLGEFFLGGQQFGRLCKDFSIFRSGGHLAPWSGTGWAILVEGIMGNIWVKLF